MEINQLFEKIYSEKPKPACTQRISIQEGNSVNEQYEIISLMILEGLEKNILKHKDFKTTNDKKLFIKKQCILLKLYLASIGIRISTDFLSKKELKNGKMTRVANFWAIKSYSFEFACLYNYIKKGKLKTLYYNPKSNLKSFEDGFLLIKIENVVLKITLKSY